METLKGKVFQANGGVLVYIPGMVVPSASNFEDAFEMVPTDRCGVGFIEIGNFDEMNQEYKFEGDVPFKVAPDGSVWARVCDSISDLPMSEQGE